MVDDQKQGGEELERPPFKAKSQIAEREEAILKFWNKERIFEKSLKKDSPKGEFVFYDGPPFASGLPHYGHVLASTIKDAIPRFRTMQGYHVARQWGWDCHGLPVENLVEKELGFKNKRDIEEYGIAKFNAAARVSIMKDVEAWREIIPRMGRWADMEHDYKTMDSSYTESVWWAFKTLFDKSLIYEGFKAMHYCPRCGTTLSNNEVALGYADIDDIAVTVKLTLVSEPDTSLLIWTTTAWTLPGNTAAAVNKDAVYVKFKMGEEFFIVAKERYDDVIIKLQNQTIPAKQQLATEVVVEIPGKDLVGLYYEPPYSYYKEQLHKHKTHAWRVYAADYVTLDSGTGIVHLAPAYGAEDLALAQKEKVPLIHHVGDDGKFVAAVSDFVGLPVKPKGRHMETDEKVVAYLEEHALLFTKEKIHHSYPHCWRCDTPLLNWAATSWFVDVQSVKPKLLTENASIKWVPEHVGKGRFTNGLASAPDWAISRSRYWGAPLPVWRNTKTKELKVIGSVEELLSMVRRSGSRYFVMRHGQARSNVEGFINSDNDIENHLTSEGRAQALAAAKELVGKGIDMIIASPLARAQETARIVCDELGLPPSALMTDTRASETHFGEKSGKPIEEWRALFATLSDKFNSAAVGGETYAQIYARVGDLLFDIERRYSNKKVLIVTHGVPAWLMEKVAMRTPHHTIETELVLGNAEWKEIMFTAFPHNEHFELDLHRPYIDEVQLGGGFEGEWKRVLDVFDCWFESGSMPFASNHYPFSTETFNPKGTLGFFSKGYPADFIAEGLDQTRGWFYSLIVLGTALFGKSPYKNVIVNGLVLASDGQKMSKRLKNYPDPMEVVEAFGADALRYSLLSSSVIRGEDLRFMQRTVEEVSKKLIMRLDNVRTFYALYAAPQHRTEENGLAVVRENSQGSFRKEIAVAPLQSVHVLDRWIFSRLGELLRDTTAGYEAYELDLATRPLTAFIDDLSTWYLRRSRDRFKGGEQEKQQVLETLRVVLYTTAHIMAPVMPFFAEDLYQHVKGARDPESVHLSVWPTPMEIHATLLVDMAHVRSVVSQALELREKAGYKIRQPLATLKIKMAGLSDNLLHVIAEELNVKEVVVDAAMEGEVWLDTTLTAELTEEGYVRDMMRSIQDLRKQTGLTIADRPVLTVVTNMRGVQFFDKYMDIFVDETNLSSLVSTNDSTDDATIFPFPVTFTFLQ